MSALLAASNVSIKYRILDKEVHERYKIMLTAPLPSPASATLNDFYIIGKLSGVVITTSAPYEDEKFKRAISLWNAVNEANSQHHIVGQSFFKSHQFTSVPLNKLVENEDQLGKQYYQSMKALTEAIDAYKFFKETTGISVQSLEEYNQEATKKIHQ